MDDMLLKYWRTVKHLLASFVLPKANLDVICFQTESKQKHPLDQKWQAIYPLLIPTVGLGSAE